MLTDPDHDPASILEFVQECRETMEQTERDVLEWEKNSQDRPALDRIFRGFHTLKGTCGFLGYEQLESIAHQVENLLSRIRDEKLAVNSLAVNVILKVIDAIRLILKQVEQTGEEGEGDYEVLVAELRLKTLHKQLLSSSNLGQKRPQEILSETKTSNLSIRVEVSALNRLRDLLELLKQDTFELPPQIPGSASETLARLRNNATQLQHHLAEVRLQPLEKIWGNLPRLVRDLGRASGKVIRLEMSGEKIRIDAGFMPVMKESLTHLLRNSVDHGIEPAELRRAAGKPDEGCLHLCTTQDGSRLTIELKDDGAGIRPEILREKALRDGFASPQEIATLDDKGLLQLIFRPGFSTAREVTKLSGRGVGLDVVKTRVEEVGGSVEVISTPGQGTLFRMILPVSRL